MSLANRLGRKADAFLFARFVCEGCAGASGILVLRVGTKSAPCPHCRRRRDLRTAETTRDLKDFAR